jgi:nitrile hydratase
MGTGHAEQPVAVRVRELEERVLAAGLATDAELDAVLARLYAHASPLNGARIVARAWTDPGYAERLLADGNAAAAELGFDTAHAGSGYRLKAVANTPGTHNMIVCTLCSCYPWEVLGLPPVWYKSAPYRSRAVKDPRGVLNDFGIVLPKDTEVRVWDSTAETRFIVLPMRPAGTDDWSEDKLADLVTRDSMIGTGLPLNPGEVK